MTALLKPTERSYGSPYQRKLVCEGYYAICLLKHITPIFATLLVKGHTHPLTHLMVSYLLRKLDRATHSLTPRRESSEI